MHEALHRFTSARINAISSPPPHSISLGGFPTPAAHARGTVRHRPASENLHISRHDAILESCLLYPPKPDIARRHWHVRLVPKPAVSRCSNMGVQGQI